jgi:antitoxin component YwqK of YwqJK toxin-antitoxin module
MSSEIPTCYVCYEEESATKPFLNKHMCACTSKADSSLKIHQLCLELSRDSTNKCSVCKTALSSQWAFDSSFKVSKMNDGVQVTQGEPEAPHGVCFKLSQTNSHVGPIRYLSETCNYQFGEKHGLEIVNHSDVTIEYNWANGKLHGRCVKHDANGNMLFECNHDAGKKHGRCVYYTTKLGKSMPKIVENYVNGEAHGVQLCYALDVANKCTVLQSQITYENGVLHGPVHEWAVSTRALLYSATYKNGFRHGRFVSQQTIHRDCTVTEEFWSDGTQELRHGLHRIESEGKIYLQAQYIMGKRHGRYFERSTFSGQLMHMLNFNNGKLHGECRLFGYEVGLCQNMMKAYGKFNNGVPVGQHVLYGVGWDSKKGHSVHGILETVNYDANGQLHGTCIFNTDYCTKSQVLNFKHGVLHGRQLAFGFINQVSELAFQLPEVAFHMKDGMLNGCVETTDVRGEIHHQYVQPNDGVTLRDIVGERALRFPAVRNNRGFTARYISATGDVHTCESNALGLDTGCTCDECYTHEDMENDYDDYENDSDIDDEQRERRQEEQEWLEWNRQQRDW